MTPKALEGVWSSGCCLHYAKIRKKYTMISKQVKYYNERYELGYNAVFVPMYQCLQKINSLIQTLSLVNAFSISRLACSVRSFDWIELIFFVN